MRGRSLLCCKQITQDVGEMHVYEYTNIMAGNANDCAVLPTLTKSSVVVFFCALDILSVVRLREFSLKKYLFLILAK